jgi:replicative DNA helicase
LATIASPRAELSVLRGMCHPSKKIAGALLSQVDETYFHFPESVELYETIKRHMHESGSTPLYRILVEDPDLSDETRQHFKDSVPTIKTIADADKAARILNKYRQKRGMYYIASNINDQLNGKAKTKLNIDDLMEETATAINVVRSRKSTKDSFLHFGKNNNSKAVVENILWGNNKDKLIPTGIAAFDDVSGGLPRGGLVTIGANSGGGKSLTANQIAINMATMGYKVLVVPLEMSEEEMTQRTMANVTKTNLTKIIRQQLATGEREAIYKKHRRWERKVRDAGGRYTIFKPKEDMTIEEVFAAISAYTCDVVIVDYISLLKGTDGDDSWQALGAIARYAKINAEIENRVNILLCQVNDEGKIRYARAISEHSNNSWIWVANKESKETGIMRVEQPKARNSMAFPFLIKMDWQYMRIESVAQEDSLGPMEAEDDKSNRTKHADRTRDRDKRSPNRSSGRDRRGDDRERSRSEPVRKKRRDVVNLAADI